MRLLLVIMRQLIKVGTVVTFYLLHAILGHEVEVGPCLVQFLEPCSTDTIQFYMYSSDYPERNSGGLSALNPRVPDWIDLAKPVKLIVHGYAGNVDFNWTKDIAHGDFFYFI